MPGGCILHFSGVVVNDRQIEEMMKQVFFIPYGHSPRLRTDYMQFWRTVF